MLIFNFLEYFIFLKFIFVFLYFFWFRYLSGNMFFSGVLFLLILLVYFKKLKLYNLIYNFFLLKKLNLLSLVFLVLILFSICICLFIFNKKLYKYNFLLRFFFIYISICIVILLFTNNIIVFFLCYEFILIPSVFLILISGINKRSVVTAIYFLIWTQFGSFLFLIAVALITNYYLITYFTDLYLMCVYNVYFYFITIFLFIGLGIKIPIWPLNFWLLKTHVEANTGFSIFLSGILVKTALFAFYKFFFFFSYINYYFFFILFYSIIDACLRIISQVDYKKIIAFATIFEMNFILINYCFCYYESWITIIYFLAFHTIMASLFFFIVDLLYKNYNTRIVNTIARVQRGSYVFAFAILWSIFCFIGVPISIKFVLEFYIFYKFFFFNIYAFGCLFFFNFIFIFYFAKFFFKLFFGCDLGKKYTIIVEKKDGYIFAYMFVLLFFLFCF